MITPESLARRNSEQAEQSALFCWAALNRAKFPELEMLYHVPNGGSRHKVEAARLKVAGVRPGVPDIALDVARQGYHGLRIEMKHGKGKVDQEQAKWHDFLRKQGYAVYVCYSWQSAAEVLLSYLGQCETFS